MRRYLALTTEKGQQEFHFDTVTRKSFWGPALNPSEQLPPLVLLRSEREGRRFHFDPVNGVSTWAEPLLPTVSSPVCSVSAVQNEGPVLCQEVLRPDEWFVYEPLLKRSRVESPQERNRRIWGDSPPLDKNTERNLLEVLQLAHGRLWAAAASLELVTLYWPTMEQIERALNSTEETLWAPLKLIHQALALEFKDFEVWRRDHELKGRGDDLNLWVRELCVEENIPFQGYAQLSCDQRVAVLQALAGRVTQDFVMQPSQADCFRPEVLGQCDGSRYIYFSHVAPNRLYREWGETGFDCLCRSKQGLLQEIQNLSQSPKAEPRLKDNLRVLNKFLLGVFSKSSTLPGPQKSPQPQKQPMCVACQVVPVVRTLGQCSACAVVEPLPPANTQPMCIACHALPVTKILALCSACCGGGRVEASSALQCTLCHVVPVAVEGDPCVSCRNSVVDLVSDDEMDLGPPPLLSNVPAQLTTTLPSDSRLPLSPDEPLFSSLTLPEGEEKPSAETAPEVLSEESPAAETEPEVLSEESPAAEMAPEVLSEESPAAEMAPEVLSEESPAAEMALEVLSEKNSAVAPEVLSEESPAAEMAPKVLSKETPAAEMAPEVLSEETPAAEMAPEVLSEDKPAAEMALFQPTASPDLLYPNPVKELTTPQRQEASKIEHHPDSIWDDPPLVSFDDLASAPPRPLTREVVIVVTRDENKPLRHDEPITQVDEDFDLGDQSEVEEELKQTQVVVDDDDSHGFQMEHERKQQDITQVDNGHNTLHDDEQPKEEAILTQIVRETEDVVVLKYSPLTQSPEDPISPLAGPTLT